VLIEAAAALVRAHPELRARLQVVIVGGPSGSGLEHPESLDVLARQLGVRDLIRFEPPTHHDALADWYRAATVVAMPSRNASFGLVAVEAQACGTPVVASAVGGLRTVVADGVSGTLVDSHDPRAWADAIGRIALHPAERHRLGSGAALHARRFSWQATAERMLDCYAAARSAVQSHRLVELAAAH